MNALSSLGPVLALATGCGCTGGAWQSGACQLHAIARACHWQLALRLQVRVHWHSVSCCIGCLCQLALPVLKLCGEFAPRTAPRVRVFTREPGRATNILTPLSVAGWTERLPGSITRSSFCDFLFDAWTETERVPPLHLGARLAYSVPSARGPRGAGDHLPYLSQCQRTSSQ